MTLNLGMRFYGTIGINTSYAQESIFSVPPLLFMYDINTLGIWENVCVCFLTGEFPFN